MTRNRHDMKTFQRGPEFGNLRGPLELKRSSTAKNIFDASSVPREFGGHLADADETRGAPSSNVEPRAPWHLKRTFSLDEFVPDGPSDAGSCEQPPRSGNRDDMIPRTLV